jgi:lysophospholipase L1-like esterase
MHENRVWYRHQNIWKLVAAPLLLALLALPLAAQPSEKWVGSWAAAGFAQTNPLANPDFGNATLRQIVHVSMGGEAVRLRFTNEFGTEPLTIGAVHVALSAGNGAIQPGTDHAVTFGGRASITIPAGAVALSDAVAWQIPALSDLAISTYFPAQQISISTFHPESCQNNYLQKGNLVSAQTLTSPAKVIPWYFLRSVDVQPKDERARAIVTLGDSITDGARSTRDRNQRWPNELASRLQASKKTAHLAVLNLGISGNRVLHDGAGPSALARFDRDVLMQPGVKYIILLESINDIGRLARNNDLIDLITAEDLQMAYQQMAARAHAHQIKIFAATVLPYKGAGYYSERGEAVRQALNSWIRTSGVFDGVIDLEKATQDPANPQMFLPQYDSGDHLHPNDAGYKAMGDAIDLKLFEE